MRDALPTYASRVTILGRARALEIHEEPGSLTTQGFSGEGPLDISRSKPFLRIRSLGPPHWPGPVGGLFQETPIDRTLSLSRKCFRDMTWAAGAINSSARKLPFGGRVT